MEVLNADILPLLATLTGLTIGVTQILKQTNLYPSEWSGLVSLLVGIGLSFIIVPIEQTVQMVVIAGIMAGLSASGAYDLPTSIGKAVKGGEN